MKNLYLVLTLVLTSYHSPFISIARADDATPDPAQVARDFIDAEQAKVSAWNADYAKTPVGSPKFAKTGIGMAGGLAHTPGDGTSANGAAAFSSRIFQEGSLGKPDFDKDGANAYRDPNSVRQAALQAAGNAISQQVSWKYNSANPHNARGKMNDQEVEAATSRDLQAANDQVAAAVNEKANHGYDQAYAKMKNVYETKPEGRPLVLFEGNATYNMIGKSQNNGAFTGITGSARAGLGFTFKNYGQNGCDIYFLGTGNAEASGFYHLEGANSARAAVGIEQGILCQIANTVTIMGSPSVQAGKFEHSTGDGGPDATTDWLNYSARVRAIVDGRLYIAAESVLHPSMKKATTPGSHWEASENSLTISYALHDSPWVAGADLKSIAFHDEASATTGNKDIHDNSILFSAIRAF